MTSTAFYGLVIGGAVVMAPVAGLIPGRKAVSIPVVMFMAAVFAVIVGTFLLEKLDMNTTAVLATLGLTVVWLLFITRWGSGDGSPSGWGPSNSGDWGSDSGGSCSGGDGGSCGGGGD
jgi:hypothetical protein